MSKIITKKDLDLVIESTLKEVGLVSEEGSCDTCGGADGVCECGTSYMDEDDKPDYIDLDGDGDKKESMKKASKDKKEKDDVVESSLNDISESINQTTKKEFLKEEMDTFNKLINYRK
jgi:hypothetical protein